MSSFRDHHDEATLGTNPFWQLLARSRNYRRFRDGYWAVRGAHAKWRTTSHQWACHIWTLPTVSLRRRGTLLRTIWDQWWHGESRTVCGSPDGSYELCNAVCECPSLDSHPRVKLFSINGTAQQISAGPKMCSRP